MHPHGIAPTFLNLGSWSPGAGFIPIISTKRINQIKKGSFMYTKRFNTYCNRWVQFLVGAIPFGCNSVWVQFRVGEIPCGCNSVWVQFHFYHYDYIIIIYQPHKYPDFFCSNALKIKKGKRESMSFAVRATHGVYQTI